MKEKKCTKCRNIKSVEHFCKNTRAKDGLNYSCRKCANLYYKKNRKYILNKTKEYANNNKIKISKYQKEYQINNRNKLNEYGIEYRNKDTKKWREYSREYYNKNKDVIVTRVKKWVRHLASYSTFAEKINWCESIRKSPHNANLLQVRCTESNCGIWFTPTNSQVQHRIQSLKGNYLGENRFYCSDKCKFSCNIYRQHLYPKDKKPTYYREVQPELARLVLERDNYECQRCGFKIELECHHFEGIYQNPIESADIDICITLCKICHKKAHKDIGCRYIDLRC